MQKDTKITRTCVVEITASGYTDNPKYFDKCLKERLKDICVDIWSGGISGSCIIKTKKIKIIEVKP